MLDSKTLGQLLLMQSIIIGLPDKDSIFNFVCRGLIDLPGVKDVKYNPEIKEKIEPGIVRLSLICGENNYGDLLFEVENPAEFSPYIDYLENFCFMVAVILEERNQRMQNIKFQEDLEAQVEERTAQLTNEVAEREIVEETLRESEERYRTIIQTATNGFWMTDTRGNISDINDAYCKMSGYSREELLGLKISDLEAVESSEHILKHIEQIMRVGTDRFETKHKRKDGSVYDVEVSAQTYYIKGEKIVAFIEDITERKKAEAEIEKGELKLNLFIEYAPAAIAMFDNNMKYLAVSKRFLSDYRLGKKKVIGRSHYEVFPDVPEKWKEIHQRCLNGAIEKCEDDLFPRQDGRLDWVRWEIHPWFNIQNEIGGIILFSEVITERKNAEKAIKESEEYNRKLFENSPIGLAVSTMEGSLVYVNRAYSNIIGRTIEEVLKLTYWDITPRKYIDNEQEQLKSLETTGHYGPYEKEYIHKNGSLIPVRLRGSIIDLRGEKYIWSSVEDITERKTAEERLRESELKFRTAFLTSPDSININRLDNGTYVTINKGFTRIMGYTEEDVLGKSSSELNIWENPLDRMKLVAQLKTNGFMENLIARFRMKNGGIRYGMMSASLIELNGIAHIISITRDITEMKMMEEALRNSEKNYRELIDGMNETIWVVDFEGDLIDVNKTAVETLGYSKEELLEIGITGIDTVLSKEKIKILAHNMPKDKLQIFETSHRKKNGEFIPVEVYSSLVTYQGKNAILSIVRDITERKKNEKELVEAKELAENADKLKSEFLAQMSHEIRSPINTILNSVSFLKDVIDHTNEDVNSIFPILDSAGSRIIRTIDSILNMSELQLGIYEPNYKFIHILDDVLKILCSEFKYSASLKNLEFICQHDEKDLLIYADQYSTSQIFSNLIDNAIKYTDKGKIIVNIYRSGEGLLNVEISDTGIGISKEFLPTLFTPFSQEEQGYSRKYEGNGLGLALIKKYCEINNAEISVKSRKNKGSVFKVVFNKSVN